ncbi:MAG: FAD-dependent oxidoreductase [Pirellulaceae bacterium]
MKTVAVFGAGIAGLSAAHEFTRLGYTVSVYEANGNAGGFFRSARIPENDDMPSEYSWHGFGPWYHNAFDVMKQIPFDESGTVYDKGLSRPIGFGLAPDNGQTQFNDGWVIPVSKMFRMSGLDSLRWGWLLLKTWAANRRTFDRYSRLNAAEQWKPILSELGYKTWRACFGPWVGSDWTNVSLHQVGQFFRKQLITRPSHYHAADTEGPAWKHGAGDGWLLLRGPSSECWIDRWVEHLQKSRVTFHWQQPLGKLDFDGREITAAHLESGAEVQTDIYVLATNPFAAADILRRTPQLAEKDQLCLFAPLTQDGPHTQVSFRIAFSEQIAWPRKRAAVIIADSEFNLTLCAAEQVWAPDVDLGVGVKALWTGTACVGKVAGRLYGLPVVACTKEQFIEEVLAQIFSCGALDLLIKEANEGRDLRSFPILRVEVWHEWLFSSRELQPHQPKWVTTTNTQPYQPTQATPVPNLVLAGAHTRTAADVWSIEGAVESGRLAAQVIAPSVKVIPQYKPLWLRAISAVDDVCFSLGAAHVLDLLLGGSLILLAIVLAILLGGCCTY